MHLPRRVARLFAHPYAPYLFALVVEAVFIGYVKDDAYIEFRYATNAAHGHGLVYNIGDPPVEGFTSFLWTLFLIVPAWLRVSLLPFSKIVGAASLCGTIETTAALVRARGGDERAQHLGRWLVATNASMLVWAQSGMESVPTALVVVAAAYALEVRRHALAMALAALAAAIRPECHVVLFLAAAVVVRRRAPWPALLALALVGAMHLWRWRYFGALVPNTALVKGGRLDWPTGMRLLGELMVTCLAGAPILVSLVEAYRKRDDVALLSAASLMVFCAYLVRVGRDEMFLVRLFLPVWPLALALASSWLSRQLVIGVVVCLTGVGFIGTRLHSIHYHALGERSHVVLAELMKRHARPGDMVVFQDLGQTPWAAMELRFVDPIGLVDRTIARARWSDRASPFMRVPSGHGQAVIRDHLLALAPKLIAFVAYIPDEYAGEVTRDAYETKTPYEKERLFGPYLDHNSYYCGLHDDLRFRQSYFLVDIVRRKDNYWFVLYEKN